MHLEVRGQGDRSCSFARRWRRQRLACVLRSVPYLRLLGSSRAKMSNRYGADIQPFVRTVERGEEEERRDGVLPALPEMCGGGGACNREETLHSLDGKNVGKTRQRFVQGRATHSRRGTSGIRCESA